MIKIKFIFLFLRDFFCKNYIEFYVKKFFQSFLFLTITPTFKIPTNFEMFQAFMQFLRNVFGFIVGGVIQKFSSQQKNFCENSTKNPFTLKNSYSVERIFSFQTQSQAYSKIFL